MATKTKAPAASPEASTIRPIGARVLIRLDDAPKMVGGIHLPESAIAPPQHAVVVALGIPFEGAEKPHKFTVKVDDRVVINKFGGTPVVVGGANLTVIDESEIVAVYR